MEAVITVAPTLEQVAHRQTNELFDAVALLSATIDRLDLLPTDADELHHTQRLVQLAHGKVTAAIKAFDPYI